MPPGQSHGSLRKDLVIMVGDVAGYSRLMEQDEDNTHARLWTLKSEVIGPMLRKHGGRLVKDTGDGFLAAFDEPSPAVSAALELQDSLLESAVAFPAERRLVFRLGLNVASTILEGEDIFGDGVNVASRLENYAEPGDIVLAAAIADRCSDLLETREVVDLGELRLRNISRTVAARGIRIGSRINLTAAAPPSFQGATGPSIAVLPFRRPGRSKQDDYIVDSIAEEVIHALSMVEGLFVISGGSTRRYLSGSVDVRAIGRELDVRYVLSGSVRKHGARLQVITELNEADTARVLRTDKFEAAAADLFDLQERIALATIKNVAPDIHNSELRRSMRKRPENLSAYELVLQALHFLFRLDRESHQRARGLLEQAMKLDDAYAPAFTYTAYWHIFCVGEGLSIDPAHHGREAERMALAALNRDPSDTLAMAMHGHVQSFLLRDFEKAASILDRAVRMGPNCAMAWAMSSVTQGYLGDGDAAVQHAETGLRLSPQDAHAFWYEGMLAQANYIKGHYEASVAWARRAAAQNPSALFNLRVLAAGLCALGKVSDASRAANDILARKPGFNLTDYAAACPFTGSIREQWFAHLREAGLPEFKT